MVSFSVVVVFRRDVQCEENGDDEKASNSYVTSASAFETLPCKCFGHIWHSLYTCMAEGQ